LAKCGSILPEFSKVAEDKKKEKNLRAACDSKEYEKNLIRFSFQ